MNLVSHEHQVPCWLVSTDPQFLMALYGRLSAQRDSLCQRPVTSSPQAPPIDPEQYRYQQQQVRLLNRWLRLIRKRLPYNQIT